MKASIVHATCREAFLMVEIVIGRSNPNATAAAYVYLHKNKIPKISSTNSYNPIKKDQLQVSNFRQSVARTALLPGISSLVIAKYAYRNTQHSLASSIHFVNSNQIRKPDISRQQNAKPSKRVGKFPVSGTIQRLLSPPILRKALVPWSIL